MQHALRVLLMFFVWITSASAQTGKFENGGILDFVLRPDLDGNHIDAHHGGILLANDKYWWYGQTLQADSITQQGPVTNTGVVLYSSTDLVDWKYEGVILGCTPSGDLLAPMRFERAKIIYNKRTRKFVMWFHYVQAPGVHGVLAGTADAGVASCDSINGIYTWHGYHRPLGPDMTVKDCTLFQDDDGTAYFIFDSYPQDKSIERCLYIARLSDDYLKSVEVRKIPNAELREAPAMIKTNGNYFLISSGVSGWMPNAAKCHRATNIRGPYEDLGNFCTGESNDITFNAQSTFIFELRDKPGSFIFMGDRWNREDMQRSAHIWLPLNFPTIDTVSMSYHTAWDLHMYNSNDHQKNER